MTPHPDPRPPGKRRRERGTIGDAPHTQLALELRTMSLSAVARKYGVARTAARYWRDHLGISGPTQLVSRGPALQPRILAYLAAHPEGCTRGTLAQALNDTPLMLYRTLVRLEKRGLVWRTLVPVPGRYNSQSWWFPQIPQSTTP